MKKIIMVLMMVFSLSAVFAKPVDFEIDEYYIFDNSFVKLREVALNYKSCYPLAS